MMVSKYSIGLVVGSWIIFFVFLALAIFTKHAVLIVMTALTGIFSIFNLYFFRDPERQIPNDPRAILSPADGKVIQITEVDEREFFKQKVTRLSIFLSVFDVHINRVPISGRVEFFRYRPGRFLPAFQKDAPLENEQTAIGIVGEKNRAVLFTQVAGILARRIVCTLREGYEVTAGERMGMIRYGSRTDVYFPAGDAIEIRVKVGDRVKGGETILGVFR
ncbi:MAG: phosphatidylserine decarboxylase family protein [Calditrichia bacterium]